MSKTTIRNGDNGDLVREAQQKLVDNGEDPGSVDGWFGPRTQAAVESFQSRHSLQVDGVVGDQTWAALDGDFSVPPGTSDHQGGGHDAPIELTAKALSNRESDSSVRISVRVHNTGRARVAEGTVTCELRVVNPAPGASPFEIALKETTLPEMAPGEERDIVFEVEAPKLETYYQSNIGIFDSGHSYAHAEEDFH